MRRKTMSVVELAPVVKSVDVRRTPADAFRLFTQEISAWWPMKTHSRAKDAAGEVTVRMEIETRVGGRMFETLNTGERREWGEVLAFEPGKRLVLLFQMRLPREKAGEVEVRFEPSGEKSWRVTLTRSNWENWGDEAAAMRGRFDGGWEFIFVDSFGNYAGPAA